MPPQNARWYLGTVEAEKSEKLLISYIIVQTVRDNVEIFLKLQKS